MWEDEEDFKIVDIKETFAIWAPKGIPDFFDEIKCQGIKFIINFN